MAWAGVMPPSVLRGMIPDITREHWNVNIRKFVVKADHLEDLVRLGTLTSRAARFLAASVVAGLNILVAGGTQAGKTTMLNCLSSAIPSRERVVTCEEVFEDQGSPVGNRFSASGSRLTASDQSSLRPVGVAVRHRELVEHVHDAGEQRWGWDGEAGILHVVGVGGSVTTELAQEWENSLVNHLEHDSWLEVLEP